METLQKMETNAPQKQPAGHVASVAVAAGWSQWPRQGFPEIGVPYKNHPGTSKF